MNAHSLCQERRFVIILRFDLCTISFFDFPSSRLQFSALISILRQQCRNVIHHQWWHLWNADVPWSLRSNKSCIRMAQLTQASFSRFPVLLFGTWSRIGVILLAIDNASKKSEGSVKLIGDKVVDA